MEQEKTGFIDGLADDATPESNQANESHDGSDSKQTDVAQPPKWKAQLPDDLKTNKDLDQYDSIAAMARAVLDRGDGSQGEFAVPADDDAEAWEELYKKLGRPEKPDDYELDSELTEDVAANLRTVAHEMGLNNKQLAKLAQVMGTANDAAKVIESAMFTGSANDCEAALKKEYGDRYDEMKNYMKRGAKDVPPELNKLFRQFGHFNNPAIAKFLAQYGMATAPDVPKGGEGKTQHADGWDYPE